MKIFFKVLVRIIPVILSFIILAAHFQRIYMFALSYLILLVPFILIYKKPISVRIIQGILILGSLEWIRIIFVYSAQRSYYGEPWIRLAVILGAVAVFTLLSSLCFRNKTIKGIYKIEKGRKNPSI